ncbi:hypothetical protein ACJMK2_029680 [Sinanodonta woodiana]|uniref:Uncharacterized protein n=1 Tax=Sinanodonta woodiana TaxID=1069815 RepID=A0ABD3XD94_SINWO
MCELPDIGPSLIKSRIQDAILEWCTDNNGHFKQVSVLIRGTITKLQSTIDSVIGKLNNLELGFSFFKSSSQVRSLSSDETTIISNMGTTIALALSPMWMNVARAVHPISQITKSKMIKHRTASDKTQFIKQMRETTVKAINTLVTELRLKTFVTDPFTSHYSKWLTALHQEASLILSSTYACITCIEEDLYKKTDTLQMFKTLQAMLNQCSNLLHELEKDMYKPDMDS